MPLLSHSRNSGMTFANHLLPAYHENISPDLWKFGNIMLANQILNCHFMQTVNKTLQKGISCSQESSKSPLRKRPLSMTEFPHKKTFNGKKVNEGERSFLQNKINNLFDTKNPKNLENLASSTFFKDTVRTIPQEQNESTCRTTTMEAGCIKAHNTMLPNPTFVSSSLHQHPFADKNLKSTFRVNHEFKTKSGFPFLNHNPSSNSCAQAPLYFSWVKQQTSFNQSSKFSPPTGIYNSKAIQSEAAPNANVGGGLIGKEKRCHQCGYCGKLYSRKYGLKIHIRTHTGYKPLKCKICGRPFGDPSNLNKHVRLHAEGATPYRCQFCGKVLVRRRDLERHINSRHPEKKACGIVGNSISCTPADSRLWSAK